MKSQRMKVLLSLLAVIALTVPFINCGGGGGGGGGGTGKVYLYATDPGTTIDLVEGVDYDTLENWSTGAMLDTNYAGDPIYNPVISIDPGSAWGGGIIDAGALAFVGFRNPIG